MWKNRVAYIYIVVETRRYRVLMSKPSASGVITLHGWITCPSLAGYARRRGSVMIVKVSLSGGRPRPPFTICTLRITQSAGLRAHPKPTRIHRLFFWTARNHQAQSSFASLDALCASTTRTGSPCKRPDETNDDQLAAGVYHFICIGSRLVYLKPFSSTQKLKKNSKFLITSKFAAHAWSIKYRRKQKLIIHFACKSRDESFESS